MNERRWAIFGWSLVCLGLVPLFWFRAFWLDWFNHVWLTNHYAHVAATTGDFPSMLSVAFDDAPHRPYLETGFPSLYGFLYYPLTSLLAGLVGGDVVVRVLAVLSMALAFESWRRVARQLTGSAMLGVLCGLAVAAHAYAFTNLYNRSALTEFFGAQWMAIALALMTRWLTQARWPKPARGWTIFAAFVLVALVGGTHPLTLYLFGVIVLPILAVLAIAFHWRPRGTQLAWAAAGLVALVGLLGPWVLDVSRWSSELLAVQEKYSAGVDFDGPLERFCLLPFDAQMWRSGWVEKLRSTPLLEAPLNWLLGGIAVACLLGRCPAVGGQPTVSRGRHVAAWLGLGIIALVAIASVSPTLGTGSAAVAKSTEAVFRAAQFGYRLVGPLQLALVLMVLIAWPATTSGAANAPIAPAASSEATRGAALSVPPWARRFAFAALLVAVLGIGIKVISLFAFYPRLQREWMLPSLQNYAQVTDGKGPLPHQFYGLSTYLVLGPSSPPPATRGPDRTLFLKRDPIRPWRSYDVPLDLPVGTTLWIAALVNPFTRVMIDDHEVPWRTMQTGDRCFMLQVPRTGAVLHVEVDPARHRRLNRAPWLWLAAALIAMIGAWVEFRARKRAA